MKTKTNKKHKQTNKQTNMYHGQASARINSSIKQVHTKYHHLTESYWHLIVAWREGRFFNELMLWYELTTYQSSTTTGPIPWVQ